MADEQPKAVPIRELAQRAREHYEELSTLASDWSSVIPQAIDAWERERTRQAGEPREWRVRLETLEQRVTFLERAAEHCSAQHEAVQIDLDVLRAPTEPATSVRDEQEAGRRVLPDGQFATTDPVPGFFVEEDSAMHIRMAIGARLGMTRKSIITPSAEAFADLVAQRCNEAEAVGRDTALYEREELRAEVAALRSAQQSPPPEQEIRYTLSCDKCGYLWESPDGFEGRCPNCLADRRQSPPAYWLDAICRYVREEISTGKLAELLSCTKDDLEALRWAVQCPEPGTERGALSAALSPVQQEPVAWAIESESPSLGTRHLTYFYHEREKAERAATSKSYLNGRVVPLYAGAPSVQEEKSEQTWSEADVRALSRVIACDLFTNFFDERAKRLVLELPNGRDGGGWSETAAAGRIADALMLHLRASPASAVPREQEEQEQAEAIEELRKARDHMRAVWGRGHSEFISENGRHGGSPWAELLTAVDGVLRSPVSPSAAPDAGEQP